MKAGKALNERKAEIRIQFRPPAQVLHGEQMEGSRNELVVRPMLRNCTQGAAMHDVKASVHVQIAQDQSCLL